MKISSNKIVYKTPIYSTDKNKLLWLYLVPKWGTSPCPSICPEAPLQNPKALLNIVNFSIKQSLKTLFSLKVTDSEILSSCLKYLFLKVCSSDRQYHITHRLNRNEMFQNLNSNCLSSTLVSSSCTWNKVLTLCFHFYPWDFYLESLLHRKGIQITQEDPGEDTHTECSWEMQSQAFSTTMCVKWCDGENFIETGRGHLTLVTRTSCLPNRRGLISKMTNGRHQRVKRAQRRMESTLFAEKLASNSARTRGTGD